MYHRTKHRNIQNLNFNSDSLMDILACTIGVTIIIMVLATMGARSVTFAISFPMIDSSKSENKEQLFFLCIDNRVRVWDLDICAEQILNCGIKLDYDNLPRICERANAANVQDDWFRYSFECKTEKPFLGYTRRNIYLTITEKENLAGESIYNLEDQTSLFHRRVSQLNSDIIWIMFLVDGSSIDMFRKARDICLEKGFVLGWKPAKITFPLTINLTGGSDSWDNPYVPKWDEPQQ